MAHEELTAELERAAREKAAPGTANVICMAGVEPTTIEYLWEGRLPLGMMAILDGDPGLGKSTLALDIAALISRGLPMPTGGERQTAGQRPPAPGRRPSSRNRPAETGRRRGRQ